MGQGIKILIGGLLAAALLYGIYVAIGVKKLMNFCFEMTGYKIRKIDFKYIYLDLKLTFFNPSDLDADLIEYLFTIYLNGKQVSVLRSTAPVTLVGKAATDIIIPVQIDFFKTFGAAKSREIVGYFANKEFDKIVITARGSFKGKVVGITKTINMDEKWTLAEIAKTMSEPSAPCKREAA